VLNDHRDTATTRSVVARLPARRRDGVGGTWSPLDGPHCRASRSTPAASGAAVTLVGDGDHSMVAAPIKDSYHTVWFELHEG
jgi:hypothetical protein